MNCDQFKSFDEVVEIVKIVEVIHTQTKKEYRLEVVQYSCLVGVENC
jgi:hypothetical protein